MLGLRNQRSKAFLCGAPRENSALKPHKNYYMSNFLHISRKRPCGASVVLCCSSLIGTPNKDYQQIIPFDFIMRKLHAGSSAKAFKVFLPL